MTLESFWNMCKNSGVEFLGIECTKRSDGLYRDAIALKGDGLEVGRVVPLGEPFALTACAVLESFRAETAKGLEPASAHGKAGAK